jgi:hypothetical protein
MNDRRDILTPIHKGLQLLMFETAGALGRSDFSSDAEAREAQRAVERCLELLTEHAGHEDRWVAPALERLAPKLASEMDDDHAQLERAAEDVAALWPRLEGADAPTRLELGGELRHRFDLLLAHHLRHMTWEERDVNAALWAGLTDAELDEIVAHVVADIGPTHLAEWDALVFPATNRQEHDARERASAR